MSDKKATVAKILSRYVQNIYPDKEAVAGRLENEKNLSFYFGIDPTGSQVHIGHTVALLLLKNLAKLGHKATVLIGGFTARIGDPTDKEAVRSQLQKKEVEKNAASYKAQIGKVFDGVDFEIRDNSEWLENLNLEEVVRLAGRMTVQQMLSRDMFQERIKAEKPVYLQEFIYPLLQGYDSVALKTDGEVGGNDQVFNMLVGRDLEKEILNKDKMVLATFLLADESSGKKMSKSEGEIIALEDSPAEIRRKVLALDDKIIKKVFELCTDKEQEWIDKAAIQEPREFKEQLAGELVRMYHGSGAVGAALERVEIKRSSDSLLMTTTVIGAVVPSNTQFKHLVEGGAVYVNGEKVEKWDVKVKDGDEADIGKGKFLKIKD